MVSCDPACPWHRSRSADEDAPAKEALSRRADVGFSVGGAAPSCINIFPIKCGALIHPAAHSALYKKSQCFYSRSESCNPACRGLTLHKESAEFVSNLKINLEENPKNQSLPVWSPAAAAQDASDFAWMRMKQNISFN